MAGRAHRATARTVARQRRAAERLRREVMGADGSLDHPYFRALERQLRDYRETGSRADLIAALVEADLIFVGDFHALPACPRFAAGLLHDLAPRMPELALGVEFVFTRQQDLLDRRQAGTLSDASFLRRIQYRQEWGYPWEGYRELLDRARESGVRVWALDAPPRGGYDGLRRRDEHAARQVAAVFAARPDTRLLVLFGESHLARGHLPRQVESRLRRSGRPCRRAIVFQNPDRVFWKLVGDDRPAAATVRVDDERWAVFHTTPLEKYEAYRQVLERWRGEAGPGEEIDLTPAVHDLIDVLAGWLGIRPRRRRVVHRAGWTEDLADTYPEVYSGAEAAELLGPILREQERSRDEVAEARAVLGSRGALYESRSNTLFVSAYLPGPAAGEGARFLRASLTGRLFIAPADFDGDPVATTYGAAYNETLAFLGARLVDPTTSYPAGRPDGPLSPEAGSGGPCAPPGASAWLEAHRRFVAQGGKRLPRDLARALAESRPLRRELARDLGRRAGLRLYEALRGGRLERPGLRRLFERRLGPRTARSAVLRLLR